MLISHRQSMARSGVAEVPRPLVVDLKRATSAVHLAWGDGCIGPGLPSSLTCLRRETSFIKLVERTKRVPPMSPDPLAIESFRGYLRAMARLQLAARPWLQAKLDASDLVQQALTTAHAARSEFRGQTDGEMGAWLRQILARTLSNTLRSFGQARRNVRLERPIDADANVDASCSRLDAWLAADQTSPSERVDLAERAERLANAVATLPDDQREAILAKHCHGLTLAEIAEQTGKSIPAIAGLLRRGLQALREHLTGPNR